MAPPFDQAVEGWLGLEFLLTSRQALAGFLLSMETLGIRVVHVLLLLYERDGNKQTVTGYLLCDRCFHIDQLGQSS